VDNIRHVLVDLECRMVVVREVFVIVVEVVFDSKEHLEAGLTSFDYLEKNKQMSNRKIFKFDVVGLLI